MAQYPHSQPYSGLAQPQLGLRGNLTNLQLRGRGVVSRSGPLNCAHVRAPLVIFYQLPFYPPPENTPSFISPLKTHPCPIYRMENCLH